MKYLISLVLALWALSIGHAFADSIELADGSVLEGDFVGSSNGIIMFNTGESIEAFPESEVVGIFLSAGVETAQKEAQQPAGSITIPSGTRLVIRTTDTVDSRRHQPGHRFRGQLEGAVAIDGKSVIPRGTILHGRITQATQGGRLAGKSDMAIEFTDIMIDDQLFEIATTGLKAQTSNEAGNTAGRTARAAAIGALISGKSGAKTGAAVGLGASLLTSGASINVPAGTILETNLRVPLVIPQ